MTRLFFFIFTLLLLADYSGIAHKQPMVNVEFRIAEDRRLPGLSEANVQGTDQRVYLHKKIELSNAQIDSAVVEHDPMAGPVVLITFNKKGKAILARITSRNVSKRLAIIVDGKVISAPRIIDPIMGGQAMLSSNFTLEEAQRIADALSRKE